MRTRGFTLIEMLVSTAIFTIVMVIALGALLAMSQSDRKAQSLKAAVNNLNFSMDSISRAVRTGSNYHACSQSGGDHTSPPACTSFYFTTAEGTPVAYQFSTDPSICGQTINVGCIARSVDSGVTWAAVTAPEVVLTNVGFYLLGSSAFDAYQPKVTILLTGVVQVTASQSTKVYLQTSVTQRLGDQ